MIIIETSPIISLPSCSISRNIDDCMQTTWNDGFYLDATNDEVSCKIIGDQEAKNFNRYITNLRKIEEISKFGENWNGYDAKPFNPSLVSQAKHLISELIIQPELFPTANDSIQIEWEKANGEYLEIQIVPGEELPVFQVDSDGHESEATIQADSTNINKLVGMFYANGI